MSEPRYISPMLDGFSLGQSISDHSGVECYPAMRDDSEKRYIVKKISLPASQVQVDALLLTGVFRDPEAVRAYYEELAQGVCREIQTLNTLAEQRGFVPCDGFQMEPMEEGVGYEVHMLSRYRMTLERYMHRNPMTHLGALNLGIDLCAAMAVSRESGWQYVDLKPENIYLFGDQEYRIGDLGFVAMDSLKYASLPDRYRSVYTAPEVADAYSSLNATMDTYALGLVLYQVYNLGILPFSGEEERKAWLQSCAAGEAIVPPAGADEEMAAIITKACAYDPADRWQTPAELGHALISYMQRNGAEDIPITAPEAPEPEEEVSAGEDAVEDTASVETAEEAVVEEIVSDQAETAPNVEEEVEAEPAADEPVEEAPAEPEAEEPAVEQTVSVEPAEVSDVEDESDIPAAEPTEVVHPADPDPEAAPEAEASAEDAPEAADPETAGDAAGDAAEDTVTADWIDLMDAFLAEEEDTVQPPGDEPTLRELLGGDEDYVPEAGDLSGDILSAEAADILSAAQELIEHEAPAPVVVPDPVDIPIPEPIAVAAGEDAENEEITLVIPEEDEEEAPAEPEIPAPEPVKKRSGIAGKLLKAFTALAVIAGLAFGAWYYYQNIYLQPIEGMNWEGNATQVTVTVDTPMDQSKLTVICKDTYGNAVTGKLDNGTVTFSDLVPGSQYIISLEPDGFHKLVGTTSVTYSTPAETKLMHLTAVTGQEAGSAIISFGVEGRDSESWTLTYAAEGVDSQSVDFTGHTVTVTGLTVGTAYTFTLTAPEDVLLVGENVIAHTASDLVQASGLALAGYDSGVLTVTWTAPEGVDSWIVRCFDGSGYDQLQEVAGTSAAFEGVTEGSKYTVEVTAATQTLAVRAEITADSNNISGFAAAQNGSVIELSWNYGGPVPEGGWKILWSADGGPEHILTAEENMATLSPATPGAVYSFTIQPPEGSSITAATAQLQVPAAGEFSANKLDSGTIIVEMFSVPSNSNWSYGTLLRAREQDSFKAGGQLALLYTVTKPYSFDSSEFETIFVIRSADGKLISTATRSRSWDDMWDNGYCTETVSNLPAEAGSYTLSIYIENGLLAELPFTIQ